MVLIENDTNKVTRTHYRCAKCAAEDTYKTFPGESIPSAVNCYSCGAGRKITGPAAQQEMVVKRDGMFPVKEQTH